LFFDLNHESDTPSTAIFYYSQSAVPFFLYNFHLAGNQGDVTIKIHFNEMKKSFEFSIHP